MSRPEKEMGDDATPPLILPPRPERSEWRTALEVDAAAGPERDFSPGSCWRSRRPWRVCTTLMLATNLPGKTATMPLVIYTAVQTSEGDQASRSLAF